MMEWDSTYEDLKTQVKRLFSRTDRQTDGQNICRIDAHIQEECAHEK